MSTLYSQTILDHYAHPRNWGRLPSPDIVADSDDPSCGDQVHLEIALGPDGRVAQVAFEGEGCMISMASASLFTEHLQGKRVEDLEALTEEEVLGWLDAPIPPNRRACALSPLFALRAGLKTYRRTAPTGG